MESRGEIVIYKAKDGKGQVEVRLDRDTLWLSLQQVADLFGRDKSVVSRHFSNIFRTNELNRASAVAKNATTAADGKTYQVEYFNLDAILSVGYRVNSKRGTQFRIWATQVLKDHLLRGYTVNEKRLLEQNTRLKELQKTVELMGRLGALNGNIDRILSVSPVSNNSATVDCEWLRLTQTRPY